MIERKDPLTGQVVFQRDEPEDTIIHILQATIDDIKSGKRVHPSSTCSITPCEDGTVVAVRLVILNPNPLKVLV